MRYVGVFVIGDRVFAVDAIDNRKLNLHPVGDNVFNKHRGALANGYVLAAFRKPRKVRRKLNENAVFLDRTNNSCGSLTGGELCGVFFPSAKKLAVAERYSSKLVGCVFYNRFNNLTVSKAVARV